MLEALFDRARMAHRTSVIPYVMAGDPSLETSLAILAALTKAGADAIELGVPYGDPLADGPTIAAAGQRALERGTRMKDVFALVRMHKAAAGAPIVLFTYFNPVYQYGIDAFAREAAEAGASGVIVPDIPLEEGAKLAAKLLDEGLDMPLLVAPSTNRERAARIAEQSTGFIYVVSRLGVTGAGMQSSKERLREQISMLRGMTEKPLAIGFGISGPQDVADIAPLADGVIVGSALIDAYAGGAPDEAARRAGAFIESLVGAASYRAV